MGKKIINNWEYWLVHAGMEYFSESRRLEEYSVEELVWKRTDFDIAYFKNITVVSGHTPTQNILGNSRPGYIFKKNNHIAIDCGAGKTVEDWRRFAWIQWKNIMQNKMHQNKLGGQKRNTLWCKT